ncbi:MAG: M15 family metallopeptidase [Leifsonia sp.]
MPANGQFTQADLVLAEPQLGWPKGWLTARAARAWWAIKAWFLVTYGLTITFNEGYRPLATQVFYWNLYLSGQGNPAARPGNSRHGTGEAFDLDWPFTSWSTAAQANWRANEARFGLSSAQGVADGEPWHKVNTGESTVAATSVAPIVEQRRDDDMPNPFWDTTGTGWFGAVAVASVEQMQVLYRYWKSTPDKPDTFNALQRDWIRNYMAANNAVGIPAPTMPTFDTAKLASAVAGALKAFKLTTIADPASLKQPLDDAFSRALAAWSKTIADQTKANVGFDQDKLANAVAQQLAKTGVVTTVDTVAVQAAVSSAISRATAAIAKATA